MRGISFAWTTPALLAGAKTVTRRKWNNEYASRFRAEDLVAAFDRSPRAGGRHVATIRLIGAPTLEPIYQMPESDYEAEGFAWLYDHPAAIPGKIFWKLASKTDFSPQAFQKWRASGGWYWVVRFKLE